MRYFNKSIFVGSLLAGLFLISCEKEDPKVTFLGGSAPVLTASSTSSLVLDHTQAAYSSLQFQWTDPGYQFSNGENTQDVSYVLQIDTVGKDGASFTNPSMVLIPVTAQVAVSFTVKQLDNYLAGLGLADYVPHNFAFRIMASLPSGSGAVYSNVVPITITTYLDVIYPLPANLYITGSATPGGWGPSGAPVDPSNIPAQQFKMTNTYTYQITLPLIGGGEFLFVPAANNWTNIYVTVGANDTNSVSGDAFVPAGNNFIAPTASGTYTISVNFKTGKYTIQIN